MVVRFSTLLKTRKKIHIPIATQDTAVALATVITSLIALIIDCASFNSLSLLMIDVSIKAYAFSINPNN